MKGSRNEDNTHNNNIIMTNKNNIKKDLNNSEMNETEVIMNQLELLSFTEDKSFDDPTLTLLQKSKINTKSGNKELVNNFYMNIQNLKDIENKSNNLINLESIEYKVDYNDKKDVLKLKLDNILTSLRLLEIKVNIIE